MKKIFLVIFLTVFLSSCFSSKTEEDLTKVKEELLSTWKIDSNILNEINLENKDSSAEEKFEEKNSISIKYLTDEKFLEIDDFSINDFKDLEQEITWKTLTKVDKIKVYFSNPTSSFPNDIFELKKFKAWDKTFLYRAFKKYETLDYGENIFIFEAYSWEKISKLEYIVTIEKENFEIAKNPILIQDLPVSSVYGNPVELWNWKITYSDIKWLEIENLWITLNNSEDSVTNFLKEKYKNIFYWNTKRTILGESGVSFFVVRVVWNKYFYEKHYSIEGFYWILSLEQWDFIGNWTLDEKLKTLWELNLSLREKNKSFSTVKIADLLFQSLKK